MPDGDDLLWGGESQPGTEVGSVGGGGADDLTGDHDVLLGDNGVVIRPKDGATGLWLLDSFFTDPAEDASDIVVRQITLNDVENAGGPVIDADHHGDDHGDDGCHSHGDDGGHGGDHDEGT